MADPDTAIPDKFVSGIVVQGDGYSYSIPVETAECSGVVTLYISRAGPASNPASCETPTETESVPTTANKEDLPLPAKFVLPEPDTTIEFGALDFLKQLSRLVQRRMYELDFVLLERLSDDVTSKTWDATTRLLVRSLKDAPASQIFNIDQRWSNARGMSHAEVLLLESVARSKYDRFDFACMEPAIVRLERRGQAETVPKILFFDSETVRVVLERLAQLYCSLLSK